MPKQRQRGVTLLEILVVLTLIGGLMGIVMLNTGNDQARKDTKQFAQQLQLWLGALRQEAVFQNLDFGIAMDSEAMLLLSYQDVYSQEFSANLDAEELDALRKNPWRAHSAGRLKQELQTPDTLRLRLFIDDEEVDFAELLEQEDGPLPALLLLSSDEYTPFRLMLEHDEDASFYYELSGDGFSPLQLELQDYDN
ncbi:hypothetical protein GCM10011297_13190 [Bacterioplanes sanyensis]|uniref:type II secretion system minor pseudopilin GspH n=1 Tax=Bacterioplanes sanyensis TaxID=1249553 RepID=UPI001675DC56|nr:type II secretion system minor pseudopilin GspH [Bacterioplanes sanyensis]GGY41556.1 hypothetical protein GCM10011297_13190 [Bacterioplanes sanyensis]